MADEHTTHGQSGASLYAEHAYSLAKRWADRNRTDGDPEYRIVAAVIHDLLGQRDQLKEQLGRSTRIERALASDMLDALYVWATDDEDEEHEPLHYVARGWRRDHDDIWLSDTPEAAKVDARLAESDLGVES